jgi:hypothetical protein
MRRPLLLLQPAAAPFRTLLTLHDDLCSFGAITNLAEQLNVTRGVRSSKGKGNHMVKFQPIPRTACCTNPLVAPPYLASNFGLRLIGFSQSEPRRVAGVRISVVNPHT